MSNFLIFKAAFNNSATPAIGTYTAEGATALFNRDTSISPDYYLYGNTSRSAIRWFVPTAETTDFEFVADILTTYFNDYFTYFIIADSTGTTRLRMWSLNNFVHFANDDSNARNGTQHIGSISNTDVGGFEIFHRFRIRVRKLTASSSSVEVYIDGTLKLTATAGATLVTCAKIGFMGGVNDSVPLRTRTGIQNTYLYDLSDGDVVNPGVLSGAFNRFISWAKGIFALKSDIPTVNNATLTIQRNGVNVQTFTANQSTAATANITVPTKTSDLTNDSGFITSDNTKIPLAGSNAISGSLIPATTDAYDLGGSSYQWNNAYIKSLTINGVACGDILTHNASEFVDVSSAQTIGGVKTFSDGIKNKSVQRFIFNKEYNDATDSWLDIHNYLDKNGTRIGFHAIGDFGGNRDFRWFVRGQSTNSVEVDIFGFGRRKNETSYMFINANMYINATLGTDLIPTNNNSESLGSSTSKWKSLNGINPGALSLPSSTYINVDTTNWDVAGGTNVYTPPANGWLHIRVVGATELMVRWTGGRFGDRRVSATATDLGATIPVVAGVTVDVATVASGFDGKCQFFPCQGNV